MPRKTPRKNAVNSVDEIIKIHFDELADQLCSNPNLDIRKTLQQRRDMLINDLDQRQSDRKVAKDGPRVGMEVDGILAKLPREMMVYLMEKFVPRSNYNNARLVCKEWREVVRCARASAKIMYFNPHPGFVRGLEDLASLGYSQATDLQVMSSDTWRAIPIKGFESVRSLKAYLQLDLAQYHTLFASMPYLNRLNISGVGDQDMLNRILLAAASFNLPIRTLVMGIVHVEGEEDDDTDEASNCNNACKVFEHLEELHLTKSYLTDEFQNDQLHHWVKHLVKLKKLAINDLYDDMDWIFDQIPTPEGIQSLHLHPDTEYYDMSLLNRCTGLKSLCLDEAPEDFFEQLESNETILPPSLVSLTVRLVEGTVVDNEVWPKSLKRLRVMNYVKSKERAEKDWKANSRIIAECTNIEQLKWCYIVRSHDTTTTDMYYSYEWTRSTGETIVSIGTGFPLDRCDDFD